MGCVVFSLSLTVGGLPLPETLSTLTVVNWLPLKISLFSKREELFCVGEIIPMLALRAWLVLAEGLGKLTLPS